MTKVHRVDLIPLEVPISKRFHKVHPIHTHTHTLTHTHTHTHNIVHKHAQDTCTPYNSDILSLTVIHTPLAHKQNNSSSTFNMDGPLVHLFSLVPIEPSWATALRQRAFVLSPSVPPSAYSSALRPPSVRTVRKIESTLVERWYDTTPRAHENRK